MMKHWGIDLALNLTRRCVVAAKSRADAEALVVEQCALENPAGWGGEMAVADSSGLATPHDALTELSDAPGAPPAQPDFEATTERVQTALDEKVAAFDALQAGYDELEISNAKLKELLAAAESGGGGSDPQD